jgi:hypothetical protein
MTTFSWMILGLTEKKLPDVNQVEEMLPKQQYRAENTETLSYHRAAADA